MSVHPRVCGELYDRFADKTVYYGSSPRVWGTLNPFFGQLGSIRFIPACLGNSAGRGGPFH